MVDDWLSIWVIASSFSHNDFVAILDLPEGEHQYKFFVDGQWVHDPAEVIHEFHVTVLAPLGL